MKTPKTCPRCGNCDSPIRYYSDRGEHLCDDCAKKVGCKKQ
jgi:hypothetical protein